ncbi:hypothetical protein CC79DRAFT_813558 [Sarocladium strictum]
MANFSGMVMVVGDFHLPLTVVYVMPGKAPAVCVTAAALHRAAVTRPPPARHAPASSSTTANTSLTATTSFPGFAMLEPGRLSQRTLRKKHDYRPLPQTTSLCSVPAPVVSLALCSFVSTVSSASQTVNIKAPIHYPMLISPVSFSQANSSTEGCQGCAKLDTSRFAIAPTRAKRSKDTERAPTSFHTPFQKHTLWAQTHHRSCAADQAAPPALALAKVGCPA